MGLDTRKRANDDTTDSTSEVNLIAPPPGPILGHRQDHNPKRIGKRSGPQKQPRESKANTMKRLFPLIGGRGLWNCGNTCFLNATIQCLGAIDEVIQALILTNKTTTTQEKLMICIRELQQPGTAYVPTSLIQQIPHLICYKEGEPADAHELLIAMINDISIPILQIFQGQMAPTVQCAHCDKVTITTAHAQDISLQVDADSNTSLGARLLNFFQPETLEGDDSYWCDTCLRLCKATKTLSYTHVPTILIIHLKRLILGRKIQTHVPFDMVLDMKPYMAPGYTSTQTMELIGIITHQGTTEQGHYVTITRKGDKWFSYNDAIVTQATVTKLLQTQAYILMYRKMDHNGETGPKGSRNSTTHQNPTTKKPKLSHEVEYKSVEPLTPGPRAKFPEQNTPGLQKSIGGETPQPSPINGEGGLKENLLIVDILPTTRPDPQAPTRGKGEGGGAELPEGDPAFELTHNPPLEEVKPRQSAIVRLDQPVNENTNLPHTILTFQTPGTREEGAVVGADEPGGDPTPKLVLVELELGHSKDEKTPAQNIPYQQKSIGGDTPQPRPSGGEGLPKAKPMMLDILPTNRPQALETRGEGEVADGDGLGKDLPFEQAHHSPLVNLEPDHPGNENTNFPQTMLTFLELSQGRVEELTSLLSELIGTPLTTEMTCK